MPALEDFYLPFPSGINQHVASTHAHTLAWERSMGLASSEGLVSQYARRRGAALCGRMLPRVGLAELNLLSDINDLGFLIDDYFGVPPGNRPDVARDMVAELTERMFRAATAVAPPRPSVFGRAFAQVWERSTAGMSAQWCARWAGHWKDFFDGCLTEVEFRSRGEVPALDAYTILRRKTCAMIIIPDLAERFGGFEISDHLYCTPELQAMFEIELDVCAHINDILSAAREEAAGHMFNLVLLREHHLGETREESVQHVHALIRRCVERFLGLKDEIRLTGPYLTLRAVDRANLESIVATLQDVMRGLLDWTFLDTGRYLGDEQ
ncbi:terpene synthase family protein [Streptacidiphilus sp. EB103A]|uniref:terpene synthase family protein n=1 Tax=Streptacidiphilus sp. EB103A TaxID=3156275 RepID=UPI0035199D9F